MTRTIQQFTVLILLTSILSSCGSNPGVNASDPYEPINRKIFQFNMTFDKHIIKPFVKLYDDIMPTFLTIRIRNFFGNLSEISIISNDILQGEFIYASQDTWRFLLNSTFGLGGLFDLATSDGFPKRNQYFGTTLARWGLRDSAYLVIPFLGSATVYDLFAYPMDYSIMTVWPYVKPTHLKNQLRLLNNINYRADALVYDSAIEEAFDPYIFVRDAYLQRRILFIEKPDKSNIENNSDG